MLELEYTSNFKKCLKKYRYNKKVLIELEIVVDLLVNEKAIPLKYHDHELSGKYKGIRELHLKPDDLLLYVKIIRSKIILMGISNHSNQF